VKIVIYGLTITSSWGNGHATTYRSLAKALNREGHSVHFVERDVEWYRSNRDLPRPEFCMVRLYDKWEKDRAALLREGADADAIVIGSYFPDAIAATKELLHDGCGPIFFYDIDTPITLSKLRAGEHVEYLDAALIPHYAAYLSFTGGPVLREIEDRFGSPMAIPFYCSVDPDLYRPTRVCEKYRCDLSYLGTYAADRQPKLMCFLNRPAEMLSDYHFIVAGPQYPKCIEWQPNVARIIHISPRDHPSFYSSSRFTLNLTRDDMIRSGYSPSVRLFEASACGATILSDAWTGLEDFLTPGEEILLPQDEYEMADVLRNLSEAKRTELGQRARERILSQHTAAHRAAQFENIIAQCYAGRA
jgi:spore maturation protein CgeB